MPKGNLKKTGSGPNQRKLWRLILGIVLLLAGAWIIIVTLNSPESSTATINQHTINLEIADDPEEITVGLGGRESLPEDSGMLFILPQPVIPNFWMKDMQFPIDFIWIDEGQQIVAITPSIGPDSYPIQFSPPSEIKYVLEVNAGLSAHNGWLPGDLVELQL